MTRRRHRRRAGVVNMGYGQEVGGHEAVDTAPREYLPGHFFSFFLFGWTMVFPKPFLPLQGFFKGLR